MSEDQFFAWIPRLVYGLLLLGTAAMLWDIFVWWTWEMSKIKCTCCGDVVSYRQAKRRRWCLNPDGQTGRCFRCFMEDCEAAMEDINEARKILGLDE